MRWYSTPGKHTVTSFVKNNIFNTQYYTCNHTTTVPIPTVIFSTPSPADTLRHVSQLIPELLEWKARCIYWPLVAFWDYRDRCARQYQCWDDRFVSQTECLEAQTDTYTKYTVHRYNIPYLTFRVGRLLHLPSAEAVSVRPNVQPWCNQRSQ